MPKTFLQITLQINIDNIEVINFNKITVILSSLSKFLTWVIITFLLACLNLL